MDRRWKQIALWIALLPSAGASYAQSSIRVSGTIRDPTSTGLPGATVLLISLDRVLQTESRANGSFEFDDVPAAMYEMQISARGFVKQKFNLDLRNQPAMQPLSIVLQVGSVPDMETCGPHSTLQYEPPHSRTPRLSGLVRDFYGNKPIKGAKVTVRSTTGGQPVVQAKSDRNGRFVVQSLPAGRYDLRISSFGYFAEDVKALLVPRENGVYIDTTVLQLNKIVVCQ
jgi:hypothetical protein